MNQEPLAIARFVALVTPQPVERDLVKAWFACVRASAPTGTLLSIPSVDDKGMPRTVCLVHRETKDKHLYIVPLTRDLEEDEAAKVVAAFAEIGAEGDFEVETSASHLTRDPEPESDVVIDQGKYLELCTAWAKRQHETWMNDRVAQGWRYGTEMSFQGKTNPLLLPFEQLPPQYRTPNLEEPQALLDLLNSQGYAVITKQELAAMLMLMRQAAIVDAPESVAESAKPLADEPEEGGEEIEEDILHPSRLRMATTSREEREAHRDWNGEKSAGTADAQHHVPQKTAPAVPAANQRFGQHATFGKRRA
jgi:hypothetical protein